MASEAADVGMNLQVKRAKYPDSFYGLKRDNQDSLGFDFNFQPSVERIITAFYNYQHGVKSMDLNSVSLQERLVLLRSSVFGGNLCRYLRRPNRSASVERKVVVRHH